MDKISNDMSSTEEGWVIRKAVLVSVSLIVLCISALAADVQSTFICKSDNGTMMHYSYFKEPQLDESSYSRGYKTGSINYLANGQIDFWDIFKYYDGQIDDAHKEGGNSSLTHQQHVNFTGEKGISEFYAKGFYPNNRAISAWKKIRYDDLNYIKYSGVLDLSGAARIQGNSRSPSYAGAYNLGDSRKSSHINVSAEAAMGPSSQYEDYEFKYTAKVKDGIVEIWDATGWTNRTASKRIDWEQTALIKGDSIDLTNMLIAKNMSYPAAAPERDWLSCCIGGGKILDAEIAVDISEGYCDDDCQNWPNQGTYNTLKPDQKMPSLKRDHECMIDPKTGVLRCTDPPIYNDFNCNSSSCPDFECIYQFDKDEKDGTRKDDKDHTPIPPPGPTAEEISSAINTTVSIFKDYDWNLSNATNHVYKILVHTNKGLVITNVSLIEVPPSGFKLVNSTYPSGVTPLNKTDGNPTWRIDSLNDTDTRIVVEFKKESSAHEASNNKAYAEWMANGSIQKTEEVTTNMKG